MNSHSRVNTRLNMKAICIFAAVIVSCVMAEAPYPPSGWKPNGALLVLPAKQQLPPTQYGPPPKPIKLEYGPPAAPEPRPNRGDQDPPSELERLRQKAGSESGTYHVLLEDGRLQKVEYATAPILDVESRPAKQQQWTPVNFQHGGRLTKEPNPAVVHFLRLREQERKALPLVMTPPPPARFLATIRYSDVQPVPPPIFAYKEPGLVRIVRSHFV